MHSCAVHEIVTWCSVSSRHLAAFKALLQSHPCIRYTCSHFQITCMQLQSIVSFSGLLFIYLFFYEVLCWRALQESELPLSRYSHSVFCLWGFKVLPVWWPNHFSTFEEAAVEGRPIRYAQFVWICCRPHCVTECTSPSLSEVRVREGDKSDESLNHDSNSVNTKK